MDYTFHGILQARILEWVAFPFSRGSSQPRDRTQVSWIAGISLPAEPQGKPDVGTPGQFNSHFVPSDWYIHTHSWSLSRSSFFSILENELCSVLMFAHSSSHLCMACLYMYMKGPHANTAINPNPEKETSLLGGIYFPSLSWANLLSISFSPAVTFSSPRLWASLFGVYGLLMRATYFFTDKCTLPTQAHINLHATKSSWILDWESLH